jgi:hypothetical protein
MRLLRIASGATLFLCLILLAAACAQTDEIQVYTGGINKPGEFSITLHDNYTPIGPTQPAFIGGVVPNHSLNGRTGIRAGDQTHGSNSALTSPYTQSPVKSGR